MNRTLGNSRKWVSWVHKSQLVFSVDEEIVHRAARRPPSPRCAPSHHSRGPRNTTHDDITPGAPWRRKRRDRIADAPALTSQPQRAGFPLTLELGPTQLPKPSWIKISQIRTLSVERIGRKLGVASPEEVARVIEGLNEILGA